MIRITPRRSTALVSLLPLLQHLSDVHALTGVQMGTCSEYSHSGFVIRGWKGDDVVSKRERQICEILYALLTQKRTDYRV